MSRRQCRVSIISGLMLLALIFVLSVMLVNMNLAVEPILLLSSRADE